MAEHRAPLLLLADGRFPAGGYAHSGGLEPSVAAGRVWNIPTLEAFLSGRAATAGLVGAAFAATACGAFHEEEHHRLRALDIELDARIPSPAQRATSRQLGRQFVRAMEAVRPHPRIPELGQRPHHPVAVGVAAAVFQLGRHDAAATVLHECVTGPATAAVRLLSLDPFTIHAALARLGPLLDELARAAVEHSRGDLADLPAAAAPLLDLAAEQHTAHSTRLFAS